MFDVVILSIWFHILPEPTVQGAGHVAEVLDEKTVYATRTEEGVDLCNVLGELCVGNGGSCIIGNRDPT